MRMWDLEAWKKVGTIALVTLGFTWPLIGIVIAAIITGEPICGCECHDPKSPRYRTSCSCGDRW